MPTFTTPADHCDRFMGRYATTLAAAMGDPDRGLREMARVTRRGGRVAVCMWDIATGGMTTLATFWSAVRRVDPDAPGESVTAGTEPGDIAGRMRRAGLRDVVDGHIDAHADDTGFEDYWEPFTLGVGPARRLPADAVPGAAGTGARSVPVPARRAVPIDRPRLVGVRHRSVTKREVAP